MPGDFVRHPNHARQDPRHLDDGNIVFATEGIAPAQADDEIERLVGYFRKGMRRVQPDRQQQGFDFALEILPDPAPLGRVAFTVRHDLDALRFQRRYQVVVVQRVLAHDQGMSGLRQAIE